MEGESESEREKGRRASGEKRDEACDDQQGGKRLSNDTCLEERKFFAPQDTRLKAETQDTCVNLRSKDTCLKAKTQDTCLEVKTRSKDTCLCFTCLCPSRHRVVAVPTRAKTRVLKQRLKVRVLRSKDTCLYAPLLLKTPCRCCANNTCLSCNQRLTRHEDEACSDKQADLGLRVWFRV